MRRLNEVLSTHHLLRAALFYAGVLALVYASVVFFGYTLQPALYASHGVNQTGAYEQEGRKPLHVFNMDTASPSYHEPGIDKAIGNMYRRGEFPLWNPYQAGGTPLAALYNTRAFNPYQMLQNISPTWSLDFFTLLRLWIAGFFTFLFLRTLGLKSSVGPLMGGLFYMLSGAMVWFMREQEFVNVAMVIPILFLFLEKLLTTQRAVYLLASAGSVALVLFAGQPEIAIYVLGLAVAYVLYRVIARHGASWQTIRDMLPAVAAFVLGAGLAAPLLLPFYELVPLSFNIHAAGGTAGVVGVTPPAWAINLLLPTFFTTPTPERVLPLNGVWDYLGGYIGVFPLFLIILGFFLQCRHRGLSLFFGLAGLIIVLKNFGVPPFTWLGYLPLFDQSWSNRWAGSVWCFSFAIAGAIGVETLHRYWTEGTSEKGGLIKWMRHWSGRLLIGVIASAVLGAVILVLLFPDKAWRAYVNLIPNDHFLMVPYDSNYLIPSVVGGVLVAVAVLGTAVFLSLKKGLGRRRWYAFLALAVVELWFYIPRGYDYHFMYFALIPVALGIAAVWIITRQRWRIAAVSLILAAVVVATGIDVVSPYGFPKRQDAFRPAPYIEFLQKHAGVSRIMGIDGILMPNYSSAFGLYDVRYINGLSLASYQNYANYLRGVRLSPTASTSLWFTGLPDVHTADQGYLSLPLAPVIGDNLRYYSFLGVKYFATPSSEQLPNMKLVYQGEVNIYENLHALPRTFIVHQVECAALSDLGEIAQEAMSQPSFNTMETVVVEELSSEILLLNKDNSSIFRSDLSKANIISYKPNRVVIQVEVKHPGLLVLTDNYYPGWEAKVDGRASYIYRVNGLVRGVFVSPGDSQVEFTYFPDSFKVGLYLGGFSLLVCLALLAVSPIRRWLRSFPDSLKGFINENTAK